MLPGLQIVDRYIGRQVFLATLIGVAVLSFVLVLGNLFKDVFELLVDKHLPIAALLDVIAKPFDPMALASIVTAFWEQRPQD